MLFLYSFMKIIMFYQKKKKFTFFGISLGIHWLQEKNVYNKKKKKIVTITLESLQ